MRAPFLHWRPRSSWLALTRCSLTSTSSGHASLAFLPCVPPSHAPLACTPFVHTQLANPWPCVSTIRFSWLALTPWSPTSTSSGSDRRGLSCATARSASRTSARSSLWRMLSCLWTRCATNRQTHTSQSATHCYTHDYSIYEYQTTGTTTTLLIPLYYTLAGAAVHGHGQAPVAHQLGAQYRRGLLPRHPAGARTPLRRPFAPNAARARLLGTPACRPSYGRFRLPRPWPLAAPSRRPTHSVPSASGTDPPASDKKKRPLNRNLNTQTHISKKNSGHPRRVARGDGQGATGGQPEPRPVLAERRSAFYTSSVYSPTVYTVYTVNTVCGVYALYEEVCMHWCMHCMDCTTDSVRDGA